ncbi:MAG: hypothetical protein H6711_07230 [Myxococcales bacterium]|nr:hypothetical protein [Myxococcales bacterium]
MAQTLLEPIAAGQTRFRMQGLQPDARGVAVGRETLLVFPALDRLVAFLGAYSEESSLDDLIPTMTLERARRDGGGHAILVRCAGADSYSLDRLLRLTMAVRGVLYVGGGTLFVRYRERAAPFGYDLAAPVAAGADDVVAVDLDFTARYKVSDRLDPVELIQRLSLRQVPLPLGGIAEDPRLCGLAELALVLVAPGLGERVLSYLWRAKVQIAGVRVALAGERRASLLLRLRAPTGHTLDVLQRIPGVELLVPVSPRAAVELGYRHPIHLASASTCLPGDEMYLFRGRAGRVERLEGAPRFVDGAHLVTSELGGRIAEPGDARTLGFEPLRIAIRLRSTTAAREPRGALIPWEQIELLRRLIYVVPPGSLSAARLALVDEGVLVLTGGLGGAGAAGAAGVGAAALIPLGRRICEVAPGVLVPDGYELWPRVRPALLRELLGLDAGQLALFRGPGSEPLRLRPEHLAPLDAAIVGRLQLAEGRELPGELVAATAQPSIVNQRLGRFALWGYGRGIEVEREPGAE